MVWGKHVIGHEEFQGVGFGDAVQHGHRFGSRRGFIEHGSVGDFHAGEVADHGLENEQRFETSLRDFGLIGRVRRVPAGVFEHVSQDYAGGEAVAVALADVGLEDLVAGRDIAQAAQVFDRVRSGLRAG